MTALFFKIHTGELINLGDALVIREDVNGDVILEKGHFDRRVIEGQSFKDIEQFLLKVQGAI
jgi:hypothetical protein